MLLESLVSKREPIAEINGCLTGLTAEREEADDETTVLDGVLPSPERRAGWLLESLVSKRETIAEINGCLTGLTAEKKETDDETTVMNGVLIQVLAEREKMVLEILVEPGGVRR
eukprot:CAMPEP_0172520994 /NCGR_PEP_ID=MMETSP1066-20121228/292316_1 /TAXON_ID=671091 /ORGANISM="Coscinodiscus wailesii, Strain CCMP2513" /LENGTH=113 /DNA_ID=CAMNT_0013303825 /DNA_START=678 /DNA_END=1019 /DNA_ORIENTATION=-